MSEHRAPTRRLAFATPRLLVALLAGLPLLFADGQASAQMGGMGGMGRPGGGQQSGPTQSGPVQQRQVGPRAGGANSANDEDQAQVQQRIEPVILPPADPLAISPEVRARIGADYAGGRPPPEGPTHRSFFPYYEERRGDYRFRMIPPLWLEYTRGLAAPLPGGHAAGTVRSTEDRQSLIGLLYYQRRSPSVDADVVFPAFWRLRDADTSTTTIGPLVHREAPFEHDNWLAPLYFEGKRKEGGYFHAPALLTTSHWGPKGALTIAGPYFRDRTDTDVDWGVLPFVFHGDNGNIEGARKTYTLVPPAFYYHRTSELDQTQTTVVGPVLSTSSPKRDVVDVFPLFYRITGNPQTGGIKESHTTLFPFVHYGVSEDESLFIVPGYLRRVTKSADTMLTPFYSHAETRNGATSLTLAGPLLPLYAHYFDKDIGASSTLVAPFYFGSASPTGRSFLTPLVGRFEDYGQSRTWWIFPTITTTTDVHGWDFDLWPVLFAGRSDDTSHTVIAPILWDFASPRGRTTIAAPLFWRFADATDDSILQVAGNTLYRQKRVADGLEWEFHFLPVFSYGATPQGYWWNVLFGLAGYDREGTYSRVKAFWIPFNVGNAPQPPRQAAFGW